MKQEDKELLLKDLCARLPYGVKVRDELGRINKLVIGNADLVRLYYNDFSIYSEKKLSFPYLRSLSSMNKKEAKELSILYGIKDILSIKITDRYIEIVVDDGFCSTEVRTIWYDEIISSIKVFDWLNKNHFDYRGLIPIGLAIEVTEENNPYKN